MVSEAVLYPVGGAFLTYCYLHSSADEFKALIKDQTIAAARKIYRRKRFVDMIVEFGRLIGSKE